METPFIGREAEKNILLKAMNSREAEMVAVIGRRRVGKTFLVRSVFNNNLDFELTGIQNAPIKEQLENFTTRLNDHARPILPFQQPLNWLQAFHQLATYLTSIKKEEKWVVFLDELPWMATRRSDFIRALGWFWNSWASRQPVVVVICGSAASWMIQNVVQDKGGLHNRITRRVHLMPFSLYETQLFLKSRDIYLDPYQVLQLYMAMGGIPHYLKEIEGDKSAAQNIDQICFASSGLLLDEFSMLYTSLFDNSETHICVIRALAQTWQGLTRDELIKKTALPNGGNTTKIIEELANSGFIAAYYSFGKKKKDLRYRLTDEYSLFYIQFIEPNRSEGRGTWEKLSQTQTWKTWSGYAFESICLKHVGQIKKALSIGGVYSEASSFYSKTDEQQRGVQIDLLIDRNDHVINLCELKFYNTEFVPNQRFATEIRQKVAIFKALTNTPKQIFVTLITTFPLLPNQHSIGLIHQNLTMDVLFEPD